MSRTYIVPDAAASHRHRRRRRRSARGRRDPCEVVLRGAGGAGQAAEEVAADGLVELVVERDPLVQLHQVVGRVARRARRRLNLWRRVNELRPLRDFFTDCKINNFMTISEIV